MRPLLEEEQAATPPTGAELRMVIDSKGVTLQMRKEGEADFTAPNYGQLLALREAHLKGNVRFSLEGELIWSFFGLLLDEGEAALQWRYLEIEVAPQFAQQLRSPLLETRIVDEDGFRFDGPPTPAVATDAGAVTGPTTTITGCPGRGTPPPAAPNTLPGPSTLTSARTRCIRGPTPEPPVSLDADNRFPLPPLT
jgi:hypothetical protein